MVPEMNTRLLELELRYSVPMSQVGRFFVSALAAGLKGPEVQYLDNVYLPKPQSEVSPRLRIQIDASTAKRTLLHGKKTKTVVGDSQAPKWEEEVEVEDEGRFAHLLLGAGSNGKPGNYKLRLWYTVTIEELAVNVYLDFVVTYVGVFYGPILEVETLLSGPEQVADARPKLEGLAKQLLGPSPVAVEQSCRNMSEQTPANGDHGVVAGRRVSEKEKDKDKKKKKKKKKHR